MSKRQTRTKSSRPSRPKKPDTGNPIPEPLRRFIGCTCNPDTTTRPDGRIVLAHDTWCPAIGAPSTRIETRHDGEIQLSTDPVAATVHLADQIRRATGATTIVCLPDRDLTI